jgi:hypothetical protein
MNVQTEEGKKQQSKRYARESKGEKHIGANHNTCGQSCCQYLRGVPKTETIFSECPARRQVAASGVVGLGRAMLFTSRYCLLMGSVLHAVIGVGCDLDHTWQ